MKIREFIFDTIRCLDYAKIHCQSELDAFNLGYRGTLDECVLRSRLNKVNNLIMKYQKIYKMFGGK